MTPEQSVEPAPLEGGPVGRRILVTGATGVVGMPVALTLARHNDVWALARFTRAETRATLEAGAVRTVTADLALGDLHHLPGDFDHVLNFARPDETPGLADFDAAISGHAEAAGLLLAHCRRARSVLHCSSTSLYARLERPSTETDPITDDRHEVRPTYTIGKICAEAVVRTMARQFDVPTVIARLNVPYGDNGGWPAIHLDRMLAGEPIVLHDRSNTYNPIHADDILRTIPALLSVATVPATIVNWGGAEQVSIEEWCAHLGALVGVTPQFTRSSAATEGMTIDTSRLDRLAGPATVPWRTGMERLARARRPERMV